MALTRTLIAYHWISPPVALAALDRFRASRIPIGRIALRDGMLKMGPLLHILDRQIEDSQKGVSRRFGETAVALGYLDDAQLEVLLEKQVQESPDLEEILIELGALEDCACPEEWDEAGEADSRSDAQ